MRNEYDISAEDIARGLSASKIKDKYDEAIRSSDQRKISYLTKDLETSLSLIRFFNSRRDLSPAQKRLGILLIRRHASDDVLKALDIKEETVTPEKRDDDIKKLGAEVVSISQRMREQMDIMSQSEDLDEIQRISKSIDDASERIASIKAEILNKRKPSPEELRLALKQIKPYFTSEITNLQKFINTTQGWRTYRDWAYDIIVTILSNYREQLDQETSEIIFPILPSEKDRDPFFIVFTPNYVEFLYLMAISALESGAVIPDKTLDAFIITEGKGPPSKNSERFDFRELNSWKKAVTHVRDKLLKAKEKGSLGEEGEYVASSSAFNSYIRTTGKSVRESIKAIEHRSHTEKLKSTVLAAVKYLASICDYAKEKDFMGFCATDTVAGHKMARQDKLEDNQMPRALFWCRKYSGQLGPEVSKIIARELDSGKIITDYEQTVPGMSISRLVMVCMGAK